MINKSGIKVLEQWNGFVYRIEAQSFDATIRSTFEDPVTGEDLDATIPRKLIQPEDQERLCLGALFTLQVQEFESSSGVRQRSVLKFPATPVYTEGDLRRAREKAEQRIKELKLESD